jgi:hypothetical protein
MKTFKVKLKHDGGFYTVQVTAEDEDQARQMILISENCPPQAIVGIIDITDKPEAIRKLN